MGTSRFVNYIIVGVILVLHSNAHLEDNSKAQEKTFSKHFHTKDERVLIRVVARATLTSHLKDCSGLKNCRQKREDDKTGLDIHLETPKVIFNHQQNGSDNGSSDINPIFFRLWPTDPSAILSPNFKLVVRGENSEILSINQTLPRLDCHYTGTIVGLENSEVAFSNCDNKLQGVIHSDEKTLIVESLEEHPDDFAAHRKLFKRETFFEEKKSQHFQQQLVLVYESSASGGACGIKAENLKRMHAPPQVAVRLKTPNVDRMKRSTSNLEKMIELAVFVDEILYGNTKKKGSSSPISAIQDIVFSYINSVQILYQTNQLDVKITFVMVRLEVFTAAQATINKKGGEIEGYLESFCKWQSDQDPDSANIQSLNPDHWDHGLLLTGMNLFDGKPEYDSVIGLAWVSGMCNPSFSCTINEGNNFESVYVIAHEMGHNLGMNHDGETKEGNFCNPDLYLMSPVLGPGKVTWSTCSNRELSQFMATHPQAVCLDDKHQPSPKYDFLKDGKSPGEKYNALAQCQLAFGNEFKPHLRDEVPFENLCRELWCANSTHALRAHPALEGTDCNAKPYPYGSACVHGQCLPFYPNGTVKGLDNNSVDSGSILFNSVSQGAIDKDRPAWYDPIFTKVFADIKIKFAASFQLSQLTS